MIDVAAADDALKVLFGAIKGAAPELVGDVTRPVTTGRLDALARMLPVAVPEEVAAPVRLSFGQALTQPGYVPRPGDWDVESLYDDMANWWEDEQYRVADELRTDYINRAAEDYKYSVADQLLSDYFPDYGVSIRGVNEIGPRVSDAYAQFGDVIGEDAPKTSDEFIDLIDELANEEYSRLDIDNEDISPFIELADETEEAGRAYSAFDSIVRRLDELPEDNPLRQSLTYGIPKNFVPSEYLGYWSDSNEVVDMLDSMSRLQKLGVNRDAITGILSNPRLSSVFTGYGDNPYDALYAFADMEPAVAEKLAKTFFDLPENVSGNKVIQIVRDLENPAVQETFLSLLPEWTDSMDELVETAKLLAE